MELYHGSNVSVIAPTLRESQRALDFGAGFYLTSDFDQAAKWARSVTGRRGEGSPIVSAYEVEESCFGLLDVLRFDSADAAWLSFVTAQRKQAYVGRTCAVIVGPVANDRTMTVLTLYFNGLIDEDEALARLLTQRLKDQYAFATRRAIRNLMFREAYDA